MSQRLKREKRGIEQVAKFVRHLPQPLSLLRPSSLRREAGVLCQRFRDGGVEAAIQRVEFFYGNRRILIEGELGDCLADVAIVVDDLRHVEPQGKQVAAVAGGGRANRLH